MASACPPLSLPSTFLLRRSARAGPARRPLPAVCCSAVGEAVTEEAAVGTAEEPLLVSAIKGRRVDRPPVWLMIMRQAGRAIKISVSNILRSVKDQKMFTLLRSLCNHGRFSGLMNLTPLHGMNIPFDIVKGKGPVIYDPLRTAAAVGEVGEFVPEECVPYVGQALNLLREERRDNIAHQVNHDSVITEAGKLMCILLHGLHGIEVHQRTFQRLRKWPSQNQRFYIICYRTSMASYIKYQADNGAQAVQIFDSWATELSPVDFEEFSLPYLKQIVDSVREAHPDLPLILYASGSGGLLERLLLTGVDVVSLDWTVIWLRAGIDWVLSSNIAVQGNVDPGVLFGSKEFISKRIYDTVQKAGNERHILNLGHGIKVGTPEENVAHFFEAAKGFRY